MYEGSIFSTLSTLVIMCFLLWHHSEYEVGSLWLNDAEHLFMWYWPLVYFLWEKRLFKLSIFKWVLYLFLVELWEFFIYSEHVSFIRYFLPFSNPTGCQVVQESLEYYSSLCFKELAHNLAHWMCSINVKWMLHNALLIQYPSHTSHLALGTNHILGKYTETE